MKRKTDYDTYIRKDFDECTENIRKIKDNQRLFSSCGDYADNIDFEKLNDIFTENHVKGFAFMIERLDYAHQAKPEIRDVLIEDFYEALSQISDFKNGVSFYILNENDNAHKTLACLLHGQSYTVNNRFSSIETLVRIIPIEKTDNLYISNEIINHDSFLPLLRERCRHINDQIISECTDTFKISRSEDKKKEEDSILNTKMSNIEIEQEK